MKNAFRIWLLICLGLMLAGCAAVTPLPDGSQPQGTYQGLVWGGWTGLSR